MLGGNGLEDRDVGYRRLWGNDECDHINCIKLSMN